MKPHIVDFTPVSRFTLYPRLFTERMILMLLITNTIFMLFNTIGDLVVSYFSSDNDCNDFFKHVNTYPRFSFIKK
jgi:hypothetical protein